MAKGKIDSKGTIGNIKKKHKEGNNTRLEHKEHQLTIIVNY
jgi:hypothetical protein